MKKVLIGILAIIIAVSASMAGNVLDVLGREHDRIWLEMRDNWHNLATGGTLTNGLTVTGTLTATTLVGSSATLTDATLNGSVTANGVIDIGTGGTITGNVSSGTSKYNIQIIPDGSTASATGRTDGVHIGSEANASATNNGLVGLYASVGRTAANKASTSWTAGSPDTAIRGVVINRATNSATAYDIEGAYIKAKNYSSGTVRGVHGLRVEAVNDGTDTAGSSYGIGISSDSSTIDYGVDMNDMTTPALGEIRFSNGTMLRVNTTNLVFVSADGATTNTFLQQSNE